jgi:ankyrin repeat protein
MKKSLPTKPNIDVLKREAKSLLKSSSELSQLSEAQHRLAQNYGCKSWADLKSKVEEINTARLSPPEWLRSADSPKPKATHPNPTGDYWLALANADPALIEMRLKQNSELAHEPGGPLNRHPLHYLCCLSVVPVDFVESLRILLAYQPDPNVRFEHPADKGSSLSPLWGTIQYRHSLEGVRLLLESGADPNDGECVYHAAELADPQFLELLFQNGATEVATNGLARALDFERIEHIRVLLKYGADPNDRTSHETRLHHGIRRGRNRPILELLVNAGADLNARSREGLNPAEHAAYRSDQATFQWLKEISGHEVSTEAELIAAVRAGNPVESGYRPDLSRPARAMLAHAAYFGEINLVKRLLDLGWPVDEPDNADASGSTTATPLECAAFAGHREIVRILIEHGANLAHYDPHYQGTPFTYACYGSEANLHGDQLGCLQLLLEAGCPIPEKEYTASDDARDLITRFFDQPGS